MARMLKRLFGALLAVTIVSSTTSGQAPSDVREVLVLQSFERGSLPLDYFTGNFRIDLDQLAGPTVNLVQVVVAPAGFIKPPEEAVVDFSGRPSPIGPSRI